MAQPSLGLVVISNQEILGLHESKPGLMVVISVTEEDKTKRRRNILRPIQATVTPCLKK
jgi:hypothetical protein